MIGTILNVAGILIGGILGLARRKPLSPASEAYFKVVLGAFTVFYGLRLTWLSISGSAYEVLKQLLVVIVSMMVGKLLGRALHLQKISNRIGRKARDEIELSPSGRSGPVEPRLPDLRYAFLRRPAGNPWRDSRGVVIIAIYLPARHQRRDGRPGEHGLCFLVWSRGPSFGSPGLGGAGHPFAGNRARSRAHLEPPQPLELGERRRRLAGFFRRAGHSGAQADRTGGLPAKPDNRSTSDPVVALIVI